MNDRTEKPQRAFVFKKSPAARNDVKNAREPMPDAFILAGGRGRRLGMLTDRCPKPLLPVNGKPLIVRILEDLVRNGVTRAVLLTGYRGEMLKEALSDCSLPICLEFIREEEPLGSAGALKAAKNAVRGRFFVVCGDAYGARDYRGFCENHVKNGADASILVTHVSDPGEFGLVLTDGEKRVRSFLEKPSWSEVCTDCVNTGVYLFEQSVFDSIPEGNADLARDVFPRLLSSGVRILAFDDKSYWCDVGDRGSYLACNLRASGGKSVIGKNCRTADAVIERSLLFDGASVGRGSSVRGAILMKNARVGENCVIGDGCLVGEGTVIPSGTVLARGRVLPGGAKETAGKTPGEAPGEENDLRRFLYESVFRFPQENDALFEKLGAAIGAALPPGARAGVFYGESAEQAGEALLRGLSAVCAPVDRGKGFATLAAFDAVSSQNDLTLLAERERGTLLFSSFDRSGLPPSASFFRKIRDAFPAASSRPFAAERVRVESGAERAYASYLRALCPGGLEGLSVRVEAHAPCGAFFARVLLALGARLGEKGVRVRLLEGGTRCELFDGSETVDFWHAAALLLDKRLKSGESVNALPYRAPEALFRMAKRAGCSPEGFALAPSDGSCREKRESCASLRWLFDGLAAALGTLSLMREKHVAFAELLEGLPPFFVAEEVFDCPPDEKTRCLLLDGVHPAGEGVRRSDGRGSARLRALGGRGLSLCAEAASDFDARRLLAELKKECEKKRGGE